MAIDATTENFAALIGGGRVMVDFWGPRCAPCLALMPAVERMAKEREDKVRLVKVNATENREICRELRVIGLPSYVFFNKGVEVERLTGNPSKEAIEAALDRLIQGGDN